MPGVGDAERLENTADRLASLGAEQQVKMVGHQAIAEQPERVTLLRLLEGFEKRQIVFGRKENVGTVVPAVQRVIQQTIRHRSRSTRHAPKLRRRPWPRQAKNELTPIVHQLFKK